MTPATRGAARRRLASPIEDAGRGAAAARSPAPPSPSIPTDVSGAVLASQARLGPLVLLGAARPRRLCARRARQRPRGRLARPRALRRRRARLLGAAARRRDRGAARPSRGCRAGLDRAASPSRRTAARSPPVVLAAAGADGAARAVAAAQRRALLADPERDRRATQRLQPTRWSGSRRRARGPARGAAGAARPGSRRAACASTRLGRPATTSRPSPPGWSASPPGELEKLVLAREVTVSSPAAHEAGPILGALRELFPSCFCFCVGTPEAAFIGASPELLIRRRGRGRRDRGAGRLDPAQRRPRRGRPPRRADAAQRQGPRGARDRRPPDRPRAAAALGLGRRPRRSPRSRASPTSSTSRRRSRPSSPTRARRSSWRACCIPRPRWVASRARPRSP